MSKVLVETVSSFFARWTWAGLVLPDGWFGRPYDSMFWLEWVGCVDDTFRIVFKMDGGSLIFTGSELDAVEARQVLTLFGFSGVTWQWKDYGNSGVTWARRFSDGTVQLVGPDGKAADEDRVSRSGGPNESIIS